MPEKDSASWWLAIAAISIGAAVIGGLIVVFITKQRQAGPSLVQAQALALPGAAIMTNKEDIVWTDWRGRERKITIHREVH